MADFDDIAKRVADVAQRVADVADALRGKGVRIGAGNNVARWLVMPAAVPKPGERDDDRGNSHASNGWHAAESLDDLQVHLKERAEHRRRRSQIG
jgi:hypothetical protein